MKNNNTQQQSALIAVCLILLTTFASSKLFSAEVNSVRLWRAPDHTRLVFDISEPADYKLFSLQNPQRLVIDIAQGSLRTDFTQLKLTSTPIAKMRSAVRNNGDLRVVLDLSAAIEPRHFTLDSNEQYSDRLVIDLFDKQTAISRSVQQVVEHSDRKIIIAVDAGHGGEDPGALGPKGIMEKNVVLQIAQRIERLLDRDPHFEGLLVRSSDYYLAHRKRTQLAREQRADFFISIHADAFTDSRANGASVYALSNSGATSETARFLARRENRADLIGGTSALKLGDRDDMLAGVLVDLSMTATMSSSLNAGAYVLKNMGTVARLHKKKVEQAGFVVLKSPDILSLLLETGFIFKPKEARQLSSGSYQQKMATAIYNGLVQYYTENPPLGTLLATAVSGKPLADLVASGDTLSEIAARYNTSVNRILNYNKLSSSTIRVGQELLIPTR